MSLPSYVAKKSTIVSTDRLCATQDWILLPNDRPLQLIGSSRHFPQKYPPVSFDVLFVYPIQYGCITFYTHFSAKLLLWLLVLFL